MVQVIWAPGALERLRDIQAYIEQVDVRAAEQIASRLRKAAESLESFPNRGRSINDGRRELPSVPPYIIQYRVVEDAVLILRIRHGRQLPPED
jgi:plasmid stabilization system protein ParE